MRDKKKKIISQTGFSKHPIFFSLELIHFETMNIFQHQIYL